MGPKELQLRTLVASKGYNYVGGKGNPASLIWLIGEAPGADEDASGIPFSGHAGKQLDGQLLEAGIALEECYFTNPYHVRPPENDIDRRGELGIPDDLQIEVLYEQLDRFKPPIIIALGATPLAVLCPETIDKKDGYTKIGRWKGSLLQSSRCQWPHYVVANLHPAFILREYSDRQISVFILERALEELAWFLGPGRRGMMQPLPKRELIDSPSSGDVLTYLNDCLNLPKGRPTSVDIENPFYKVVKLPYVIGFSTSPTSAISFSLWDWPDDGTRLAIWRAVDRVLREKEQIGQNYLNYDSTYMEDSIGFRPNVALVEDTIIQHKVLWPEFEHKLHFMSMQYTREPYYKDEGTYWTGDQRLLRRYNAKDCAVTYEVWEAQNRDLDLRNLRGFYNGRIQLARDFHNVEKRGILVDRVRLGALRTDITVKLKEIAGSATKVAGIPCFPDAETEDKFIRFVASQKGWTLKATREKVITFNLGSEHQVKREFARLGLYLPTEKGKTKSDEEALQRCFAATGHDLPKLILHSRGLNKLKGTNVDAKLVNDTLYTQYITEGTVNGRRSSRGYYEKTKFAFGSNTQNLPKHGKDMIQEYQHRYRECLIARPGKIFVMCDQKGAEDWLVQGIIKDQGGSPAGFQELVDGINRHKKLAVYLFKKPEAECHKESNFYFWAKKTRHAGNYDMQAYRFSVELAKMGHFIPEYCRIHRNGCDCDTTNKFLTVFHDFDPGIRGIFHAYVRRKLEACRTLVNPFGRERVFFGLHPSRDNSKVFKEAYSAIPQSTVSDNTGFAIDYIEERRPGTVVKDDHDAITTEVDDKLGVIMGTMKLIGEAFNRVITLENGLQFVIPIEFDVGYDLINTIPVTAANLAEKYDEIRWKRQEVLVDA